MCLAAMVNAQCNPRCTRELTPICGARYNNGNIEFKTHSNPCLLKYYNCLNPTNGMKRIIKLLTHGIENYSVLLAFNFIEYFKTTCQFSIL